MSRHIVMDSSGHSTFEFNPRLLADLADAERRFNQLVAKGYVPAELKDGTHRVPPKENRRFNPGAEETIFIPALKGG